MTKENIFKKKFEDLDILKGFLSTYPSDYSENIIDRMKAINEEIDIYLNNEKRHLEEFTLEEVSKYNGKDGMPAYVIIKGAVYDTSDVEVWNGGFHFGVSAGNDLTESFANCHSGELGILKKLRVIGSLKQ